MALQQMEKCLRWKGVIIIKDYPEYWDDLGEETHEMSPQSVKERFTLALKEVQHLEMESFAYDIESGDYQLWIVKEPPDPMTEHLDKVLSKVEADGWSK